VAASSGEIAEFLGPKFLALALQISNRVLKIWVAIEQGTKFGDDRETSAEIGGEKKR